MPTNQSSPWDGAKLRPCSNADSPTTTTSVSTHAEAVVATKVPFSPTSLELSRRKDQAKPPLSSDVASSASPLRQTTVAPSVCSVEENGNRNITNAQSQLTTVPDGSPNLPQQLNGIQNPHQVLKQAASSLKEPSAPSFIPTEEHQIGIDVQPTGIMQKGVSLQTSQPGSGVATSRRRAATAHVQLGRQILSSVCFRDLFIEGQPALQKANKMMVSVEYVFVTITTVKNVHVSCRARRINQPSHPMSTYYCLLHM